MKQNNFLSVQRLKSAGLAFSLSMCLASHAECPCETEDQTSLKLAYDNSMAAQTQQLADATGQFVRRLF